jgi:beta-lactamase class A
VTTLDAFLGAEQGIYGVVILDARGDYAYARNANVPFIAASLYKLVLLADIYGRIDRGEVALSDVLPLLPEYFEDRFAAEDGYYTLEDAGSETTVESALFGAGAYSSNIAARTLMSLTSLDELRATAETLGMHDTWFNIDPRDLAIWPARYTDSANPDAAQAIAFVEEQADFNPLNITTPHDIARYWHLLRLGQVVSPEASEAILEILRQQIVQDRIPWLLPEGLTTANKTGNLYHVVHDSGVIFSPDGSMVVTVLSEGEPDDDRGAQVIQRVALAATGVSDLPPFTSDHFGRPESPDG